MDGNLLSLMDFLKTGGYYAHVQTVCTRPLLGGEGPGDEARGSAVDLRKSLSLCECPVCLHIACLKMARLGQEVIG